MVAKLKRLGAGIRAYARGRWPDFAWNVFQCAVGALIGLLFATLYLRAR